MHYLIFILAFVFFQDVPYKPSEEFEVKLDYQFRQRPVGDHNTVHLGKEVDRRSTSVLPYLILNIKMLKLPEDKMRMQVATNRRDKSTYKKITLNTVVELDLGFTDDMKDRVTAHEYTLTLLTQDKKPAEIILIEVTEDGAFYVNGEKRGKF